VSGLSPADPVAAAGFLTAARIRALEADGIATVGDLLLQLPFRHEDRSRFAAIRELRPGVAATIAGRVLSSRLTRTRRRGLTITEAVVDDGTEALRVYWFNRPYLHKALVEGREVILWGIPDLERKGLALPNPEAEFPEPGDERNPVHAQRVVGVYRRAGGVGARSLREYIFRLLERLGDGFAAVSAAPASLLEALRRMHFPRAAPFTQEVAEARGRLAREEALAFALHVARRRAAFRSTSSLAFHVTEKMREHFRAILPFALTGAQKRALREIGEDLKSGHPMARLLQGDVGSGKTIVALLALLLAAENGCQGALMAPTEILAEQHAERVARLLSGSRYRIALLTGRTRGKARANLLTALATGEIDLLIGTHALIEGDVAFRRLGLVVIDEQHRFGVAHRAALYRKGISPHVLVMTATPIPRSLAWTLYGDLDVSVIDEKPPGRREVRTVLRSASSRTRVYEFVRDRVNAGEQAFVVAPSIEEGPRDIAAAESLEREVAARMKGRRVGLLHGRLRADARTSRMAAFARGEIDVLVATTVVEVGVDIPNATVLVVENAEAFGLAQLHQLRGRVGRSDKPSWCVLIAGKQCTPEGRDRLELLTRTSDGFLIAEKDLTMRGPGELMGKRQAGMPDFKVFDPLRDIELLRSVRAEASQRLASGERAWSDLFPYDRPK
jgi:ATP-dependent DNA helicase RecG